MLCVYGGAYLPQGCYIRRIEGGRTRVVKYKESHAVNTKLVGMSAVKVYTLIRVFVGVCVCVCVKHSHTHLVAESAKCKRTRMCATSPRFKYLFNVPKNLLLAHSATTTRNQPPTVVLKYLI